MDRNEYNKGYEEAKEAIKKALQDAAKGKNSQQSQGGSGQQDSQGDGQGMNTQINPQNNNGPLSKKAQQKMDQSGQSGQQSGGDQGGGISVETPGASGSGDGQKGGSSSSSEGGSPNGTGKVGGSQGTAASRKARSGEVSKLGGSYIDQKTGDQLAKEAGYTDREAGNGTESDVRNKWGKIARTVASQIGVGSGRGQGLLNAIEQIYEPKINWRAELKQFVGHAVGGPANKTAWGRKAFLQNDDIRRYDRPADNNLSNVMFMIDTSGSVGMDKLVNLLSESAGMIAAKKIPTITYISYGYGLSYIDTIKTKGKLTADQIRKLKLGDGGGTDFQRSVDEMGDAIRKGSVTLGGEKIRMKMNGIKKADLLVVFTDGDTLDEAKAKPSWAKNVIFMVIPHGAKLSASALPQYGKVLQISEDDI